MFLKKLKKADEQLKLLIENYNNCTTNNYDEKSNTTIIDNISNEDFEKYQIETNYDDINDNNDNDDNIIIDQYQNNHELSENDENFMIEYINEENMIENEEIEENKDHITVRQSIKRKVNNNKTPNIIITENVSSILSKIQKTSHTDDLLIQSSTELKKGKKNVTNKKISSSGKKIDPIAEKDCFVITKFVLTNDETTIHSNTNNNLSSSSPSSTTTITSTSTPSTTTVSQIRMFDMAPVEVNATSGINIKDSDDEETNIENLNTMYKCKYCPRAYSTSHYLIKHARKSHYCQFCMKGFEKTDDLFKHTRKVHNNFQCTLCKRDFTCNSNLRQHMKRIHNVILPPHTSILSFIRK